MLNIEYKIVKLLNENKVMSLQEIVKYFENTEEYIWYVLDGLREDHVVIEISEELKNKILNEKMTYEMAYKGKDNDTPEDFWTLQYNGRISYEAERSERLYKNTPIIISVLALVVSIIGILIKVG